MFKKFILFSFSLLFYSNVSVSQEVVKDTITTFFLIRHAEKDRTDSANKNPQLNEKGLQRAESWNQFFSSFNIDAVYSTNYNRTLQTVAPTAKAHNLEVTFYNPFTIDVEKLKSDNKGKTVLVVGHSNTIPYLVNKLIGKEIYADIDDHINSNLYIVTISSKETSHILIKTK
ncbi:MAG: phosphoglycerate mutase family protein [Flavobacteriaceae bacterium]